uniref:Zinc-dependent alcohol dehydrogenase family protein n=1 Tax=Roseihalotalea indica TaxID=2867963 RepID=A0AA49JG50_9BACT|nr:zinc-dependent alcohol dehydrogenase family protein [Tunicatimonas sp. TK19036]
MQKVVFNKAGEPQDVLTVKEVPVPEPKAGEVRIKVKATPVNPSDVVFIQGQYGIQPQFPDSPVGFEGAGEVDVIGTGIGPDLKIAQGQRVAFSGLGAWSEYIVVPATSIMPIPDNLSFEEGAQFFVNPFTVVTLLNEANLQKGDWLLLTAAFSSLNKMVIQRASSLGIRVIGTVRRQEQVHPLLELGAEAVVNTEKDSLVERVKSLTEGKGVQACFESVGGEIGTQALASLGKNGLMLIYGLMSGEDAHLNYGQTIFRTPTVKGFWLSRWMNEASITTRAKVAKQVYDLMKNRAMQVDVGNTFPLAKVVEAVSHSIQSGREGKTIIRCGN